MSGKIQHYYSGEEEGLSCSNFYFFYLILADYISITSPNKNLSDILKPNSPLSTK
jgi:hypothetical protein